MNLVTIWGYLHHDGGAGTEMLGAVELLRSRNVRVRCVVPAGTDVLDPTEPRRRYFDSLGVETCAWFPGILEGATIFCLGESSLFDVLKRSYKPAKVIYGSTMIGVAALNDAEREAAAEGLVDSWVFQTDAQREACEAEAGMELPRVHTADYRPYFNLRSGWLRVPHAPAPKPADRFNVGRISRDCPHKWHPETWEQFARITSPRPVHFTVMGWGPNAAAKVGDICQPWHKLHGTLNLTWHEHTRDPAALEAFWREQHMLFHFWDDFVENCPRVVMEAAAAGVPVIANHAGGLPELIVHGETGYLCHEPDEAVHLASHLAFNPWERDRMGAAARDVLEKTYGNSDWCWPWWEAQLNA
jgi:glycosyltransferase involved in cell wall biosynthesis